MLTTIRLLLDALKVPYTNKLTYRARKKSDDTLKAIPDFDVEEYAQEYRSAPAEEKDDTFLGRFILASLAQKSMITNKIFKSGNLLAGFSVDYDKHGAAGIKDYLKLVSASRRAG